MKSIEEILNAYEKEIEKYVQFLLDKKIQYKGNMSPLTHWGNSDYEEVKVLNKNLNCIEKVLGLTKEEQDAILKKAHLKLGDPNKPFLNPGIIFDQAIANKIDRIEKGEEQDLLLVKYKMWEPLPERFFSLNFCDLGWFSEKVEADYFKVVYDKHHRMPKIKIISPEGKITDFITIKNEKTHEREEVFFEVKDVADVLRRMQNSPSYYVRSAKILKENPNWTDEKIKKEMNRLDAIDMEKRYAASMKRLQS